MLPAEGGLVFVREGTYAITVTLTMPDKNVVIRGTGEGTVISLGANAIPAFTVPTGLTAQRTYTFEDFKILGTAVASQRGWSIQDANARGVVNISRVDTEEIQRPFHVSTGSLFAPVIISATDCHFQVLADGSSILCANAPTERPVNLAMVRVRFYRTLQDAVSGTFTDGSPFSDVNIIASESTFAVGTAACSVGALNLTGCYLYDFGPGATTVINVGDDPFVAIPSAVVGCRIEGIDFNINGSGTTFDGCFFEFCSFQDNAGSHFADCFFTGIGVTPSIAVIVSGSGNTIITGCIFTSSAEGTSYAISRPSVVSGCLISSTPAVAAINLTGGGGKIIGNHFAAVVPIIETGSVAVMDNAISGNFFAGGPPSLVAGATETLLDDKNIRTIATIPVTLDQTHRTVLSDATGGARVLNLPTAASSIHRTYIIKKIDASVNTVTIDGSGVETIDGAATVVLTAQWERITIQSNGTAWFRID